jgi:hypothetical protein
MPFWGGECVEEGCGTGLSERERGGSYVERVSIEGEGEGTEITHTEHREGNPLMGKALVLGMMAYVNRCPRWDMRGV